MLGKAIGISLPTICNMSKLPDMFGMYFHNKITNIRSCLDKCLTNVPIEHEQFNGPAFHSFFQASEEEVKNIIISIPQIHAPLILFQKTS